MPMDQPKWMEDFLKNLEEAKKRWEDPEYRKYLDETFEKSKEIMGLPDVKPETISYEYAVGEGKPTNGSGDIWKLLIVVGIFVLIIYLLFFKK